MPGSARRVVGEGNGLDDDPKSMRGAAQRTRSVCLAPCLSLHRPVLWAAPGGVGRPVTGPKPPDGRLDRLGGKRIGGPAQHVPVRLAGTAGRGWGKPARNEE